MATRGFIAAVITGHPAHGLRIHRFLEIYKPRFYVITDGSGSSGVSKLSNIQDIIERCEATCSGVMGRFTDAEIYRIIRRFDTDTLVHLVDEIANDLDENEIDLIVGDSIEGLSPTHDLCRYLINTAVAVCRQRYGREIENFDFPLHGPPDDCPPSLADRAIWIKLSEAEFARKMDSILQFPGINADTGHAFKNYGETAFRTECLRPVIDLEKYSSWDGNRPFYESYGAEKVKDRLYDDVIYYEKHLLPIARFLTNYAAAKVR